MDNNYLNEYKMKLGSLSVNDQKMRDLYLRKLALGEIQGPPTGYASIDKPWLKYYSEDAIKADGPKKTIYRVIYDNNKDNLEGNALQFFDKYITYGELLKNIDKVANAFVAKGIKDGDIVNVSLPNIPESVYVFYALSKIGAIANMINPLSSTEDFKHYINETDSNFIIVLKDIEEKIFSILEETSLNYVVSVSATNSLIEDNEVDLVMNNNVCLNSFNKFVSLGKNIYEDVEVDYVPDKAVVIEHTGGTTGTPKGVLLSNDAINLIAHHFMVSDLKFDRDQKWLNIMPPFIAYGVGNGLHLPLAVGMCVVAIPKFEPDKIDELISLYNPNNFAGVPVHYESIIISNKLKNVDFSKWVLPGVGGDTMDTNLEKEANKFLKKHNSKTNVIKGYGLTEVCAAASVTFGDSNEIGSVGIPFVKNNISIFDINSNNDNYTELGYNERGEICILSPSLMLGYFKNDEETSAVLKRHSDGKVWMHTGDIGYMNDNGILYIDGRTKRVIIRYDGFKVFPFGIEKLILSLPEVEFCKVVATPDLEHIQGNLPQANIILKSSYVGMEDEILTRIKELCNSNLAEYTIPVEYNFITEFPRTSIGKVDYVAMEQKNKIKKKKK